MIQYLCFAGGAVFGFLISSLMAAAHEDPFTAMTPDQAIEDLIVKAEPQEPYHTVYAGNYKYICPECLHGFSEDERPDYCPECGQRIAWGDRK